MALIVQTDMLTKHRGLNVSVYVKMLCDCVHANDVFRDSSLFDKALHHLQRQWENDGGVLLGRDGVEGLEVTQLQGGGRLGNHKGGLLECP